MVLIITCFCLASFIHWPQQQLFPWSI